MMFNDDFPATYDPVRRLQELYVSGQIERPAAAPVRDKASVSSSVQTHAPLAQPPAARVLSPPITVTVEVAVVASASPPLNISISVSTAGDGPAPDRPSATGDRRSARRADVDLRNRLRRLGPAENAR